MKKMSGQGRTKTQGGHLLKMDLKVISTALKRNQLNPITQSRENDQNVVKYTYFWKIATLVKSEHVFGVFSVLSNRIELIHF